MESKKCAASDTLQAFQRLSDILDTLRQQCPWDRKQTLASLRYLTIEEVHELSEAIIALKDSKDLKDPKDPKLLNDLKKELGDLAMHIMFYCKIAEEEGLFSTADVYNTICDKLVDRHPFIYRKDEYHGESWEQLKMREGRRNVLEGVPDSLPSLVKAVRMQEKVSGMAETTTNPETAALAPLRDLHDMSEEEFGEMLFALVDWARRRGINADDALCRANYRFKQRHSTTEA